MTVMYLVVVEFVKRWFFIHMHSHLA